MGSNLSPGTVLKGTYRVDRPLAEGGTSRIFIGNPLRGAGLVAIKELGLSADATEAVEDVRQFRTEYDILSTLTHPSLPLALDFFEVGGRHYLVEEFISGVTLRAAVERRGRVPHRRAVAIALQILDVLHYLHERGIIYRDLKPDNIMLIRGGSTVRLIDFGAARRWRRGAKRDTVPLGTPGFASPEHYGSAQTDARSDIWCLGAVLHYMLTGVDPTAGTPWKFDNPTELYPEVPECFSRVAMRALELEPALRYPTARAMRLALLYPSEAPAEEAEQEPSDEEPVLVAPPLVPCALLGPAPRASDDDDHGPSVNLGQRQRVIRCDDPLQYVGLGQRAARRGLAVLLVLALGHASMIGQVIPLVGAVAAVGSVGYLYGFIRASSHRGTEIQIWDEGLRARLEGCWIELRWTEIASLRVASRSEATTPEACEVATATTQFTLPGDWPGFDDVITEIIDRAELEESPRASATTGSGQHVVAYERCA